jgi:hypothetical protein
MLSVVGVLLLDNATGQDRVGAMLQIHIRNALESNVPSDTCHLDVFRSFPHSLQAQAGRLGHDRFLAR